MSRQRQKSLPVLLSGLLLLIFSMGPAYKASSPLSYDAQSSFAYATKWCHQGNDCTSGQYSDASNTDCTHFMSHVLFAGGVTVNGGGAKCNQGLCIRVKELNEWFSDATQKYSNVKKLSGWQEARKGDFCFLQHTILGINLGDKYHVMLLAEAPQQDKAKVYGHENNRCGEATSFDVPTCTYYRIANPLDGVWTSSDADHRFSLTINGKSVSWTERRPTGATLTRNANLSLISTGKNRISRENDDEVLRFLDFPDASLRQDILSKSPEASFLDLTLQGDKIVAEWHGLLVRKLPNGKLKDIVQPSQMAAKLFDLLKH